ncbi:MAG: xanthine dehydrogenase family protein subunit M [Halanaerobiales bacterium]|nr:xanthine dehydrogenase family protein subunit M [Halanaerobiales bacterium]
MIEFEALKPQNLKEALAVLKERGIDIKLLAGGTDLLVEINNNSDRLGNFKYLMDISSIKGLDEIENEKKHLIIGALCTHTQIIESKLIEGKFPILVRGAKTIGSTQIRNRGTIGGNINNGSPAADLITPLLALKSSVILKSKNKKRELPLQDFITGPYKTDRKEDEILTKIKIPKINSDYQSSFQKVKRRQAVAISRINLAVVTDIKEMRFNDIRIAFGSATPTAIRFLKMEKKLKQTQINELNFDSIIEQTGQEMVEIAGERWSTPYKKPVVGNLLIRALQEIIREVQ